MGASTTIGNGVSHKTWVGSTGVPSSLTAISVTQAVVGSGLGVSVGTSSGATTTSSSVAIAGVSSTITSSPIVGSGVGVSSTTGVSSGTGVSSDETETVSSPLSSSAMAATLDRDVIRVKTKPTLKAGLKIANLNEVVGNEIFIEETEFFTLYIYSEECNLMLL